MDSIVPMINVAFLLLIFFLMAAVLAPPDPVEVSPPVAEGEGLEAEPWRFILGENGQLEDASGAGRDPSGSGGASVQILTDASTGAEHLAAAVARLEAAGAANITLIARRP